MLLPDNIQPELSLYYNGAFVLEILQRYKKLNIIKLYDEVKKIRKISFSIFALCLDWLYLIDVVNLNNIGEVELCF